MSLADQIKADLLGTPTTGNDLGSKIQAVRAEKLQKLQLEVAKKKAEAEAFETRLKQSEAYNKSFAGRLGIEADDNPLTMGFKALTRSVPAAVGSLASAAKDALTSDTVKERGKEMLNDVKTPSAFPVARTVGNIAMLANEVIGETASSMFKQNFSEDEQEKLGEVASNVLRGTVGTLVNPAVLVVNGMRTIFGDKTASVADTQEKAVDEVFATMLKGADAYESFKNKNKFTESVANDVEGVVGVLTSLAEIGYGAKLLNKAKPLYRQVANKIDDVATMIGKSKGSLMGQTAKQTAGSVPVSQIAAKPKDIEKMIDYISPVQNKKAREAMLRTTTTEKGYTPGSFLEKVKPTASARQIQKAELASEMGMKAKNPVEDMATGNAWINKTWEEKIKPLATKYRKEINPKSFRLSIVPKNNINSIKGTDYEKMVNNVLDDLTDRIAQAKYSDEAIKVKAEWLKEAKVEFGNIFGGSPTKAKAIVEEINNNITSYIDNLYKDAPLNFRQEMMKMNLAYEMLEDMSKRYEKIIGTSGLERLMKPLESVPIVGKFANKAVVGAVEKTAEMANKAGEFLGIKKPGGKLPLNTAPKLEKNFTVKKNDTETLVNVLYKKAPVARDEINNVAQKIADELGGIVAKANLKKREKVLLNIKYKFNGDVSRVTDIARNTIVVDDPKTAFSRLQNAEGYLSGEYVDPSVNAFGYSGYNTKYLASNGHIAEIQINTPAMIYAKEPKESAIAQLGEGVYKKLDKEYNGIGGKGHLYYDEAGEAARKEDFNAVTAIQEKSRNYYKLFR